MIEQEIYFNGRYSIFYIKEGVEDLMIRIGSLYDILGLENEEGDNFYITVDEMNRFINNLELKCAVKFRFFYKKFLLPFLTALQKGQ